MKTVTVISLLATLAQPNPAQERAVEKAALAPHPGAADLLDKTGGFSRSAAERQKPKRAPQGWGYGGWWENFGREQSAAPTAAATAAATPTTPTTTTDPARVAAASSTSAANTTYMCIKSQWLVA